MDLLLGLDLVLDLCLSRQDQSRLAVERCLAAGWRVWLHAGSSPAYVQALADGLAAGPQPLDRSAALAEAQRRITALAAGKQWMAALAGDGLVCASDAQAFMALRRFPAGSIRMLTRNAHALGQHPDLASTPEAYLAATIPPAPLAFIDLAVQQDRLRAAIEDRLHRVLHHGHYIMGPEIAELEARLAAYVGVKYCLTAASGTDTLEIAMRALGIGPGHEVITTPFTWISTAETIAQVGADPVFVDIEPASFNIDVDRIEAAITPRTRAIMPVSLFGQMPDLDRINTIAARHGLPVIEDAAQSFGATRHGRRSCGVTTIGSTSFFPAKPLGCYGDGGALFTDDDALAAKMRAIRTHGGEKRHHHPYIGMNGRLDTLQAAVVLAKLDAWDWEVERRNHLGARYTERLLAQAPAVSPPLVAGGNSHVYAQYTVRSAGRDALAERLKAAGIPSAVYYPKCLHEQPCFAHLGRRLGDFPEAERASREVLSLPMHPDLTEAQQDRVITALAAG